MGDAVSSEQGASPRTKKVAEGEGERTRSLAETWRRASALMLPMGVTRVADLTGLDHLGIPVAAAYRPNARSVSVAQGKGQTVEAARVSALMEALEGYCAERVSLPLRLATVREMRAEPSCCDLAGLPRTRVPLDDAAKLLWVSASVVGTHASAWVPLEVVQTDFTRPAVGSCGAFVSSSNGLASGNHADEALLQGICELVERDANTLWWLATDALRDTRRIDLHALEDPALCALLHRVEGAEIDVALWETTTDVGIPAYVCWLADRHPRYVPIPPVQGSGCHVRRETAIARAMLEAVQGRITRIAAAREDLDGGLYSVPRSQALSERFTDLLRRPATRKVADAMSHRSGDVSDDVAWARARLSDVGLSDVLCVDLTPDPHWGLHFLKVIIPGLEGLAEAPHYVPGRRANSWRTACAAR